MVRNGPDANTRKVLKKLCGPRADGRTGLVVDVRITQATGTAERDSAWICYRRRQGADISRLGRTRGTTRKTS